MGKHRPIVCILDNVKDRCLREEQALDKAIFDLGVDVSGISNFGENHLARTGLESFPAIEVDGVYFTGKQPGEELTYEMCCDFLDMLVRKGIATRKE